MFRTQFFPMVGAEAVIWTPVQYLNFTMLPVQHQQMFVNVISIVEAAALSWCVLQYTAAKGIVNACAAPAITKCIQSPAGP